LSHTGQTSTAGSIDVLYVVLVCDSATDSKLHISTPGKYYTIFLNLKIKWHGSLLHREVTLAILEVNVGIYSNSELSPAIFLKISKYILNFVCVV
jgi:hypothetical protein